MAGGSAKVAATTGRLSYRMRNSRSISTLLAALWTLCICHGLIDLVSRHWHLHDSGQLHHHHDPVPGSSHHDHGEPLHGHSHDSPREQCCESYIRLTHWTHGGYRELTGAAEFEYALPFLARPEPGDYANRMQQPNSGRTGSVLEGYLRQHIRTLISPNAPPV